MLFYRVINYIFQGLNILIFIRVILSWVVPNSRNGFTDLIYQITEPILKPFRDLMINFNMRIDISPILAYYALRILRRVIFYLL